jgi:hypothetical protein
MSSMRKERVLVGVFLLLICLVMAHAVHNGWYLYLNEVRAHPAQWRVEINHAPEGYRIGIPTLVHLVTRVTPIQDTALIAAGFDFISGFFACYLFFLTSVDFLPEIDATVPRRVLVSVLFLAIIQFPMAWVVPWQRQETLPTSLYLALVFYLFVRMKRDLWWVLAILAVTAIQCFFRTDVPFCLGVAIVLLSFLPGTSIDFWLRRWLFFLGCLVALVSAGIQASLQYVFLPNLPRWPGVPLIMVGTNLHNRHSLFVFFIATLPFLLFAAFLAVRRPALHLVDKLILIVSTLYLPVWFAAGSLSEVRLFVPFMFALSTVAAKVLASYLSVSWEPIVDQSAVPELQVRRKTKGAAGMRA